MKGATRYVASAAIGPDFDNADPIDEVVAGVEVAVAGLTTVAAELETPVVPAVKVVEEAEGVTVVVVTTVVKGVLAVDEKDSDCLGEAMICSQVGAKPLQRPFKHVLDTEALTSALHVYETVW